MKFFNNNKNLIRIRPFYLVETYDIITVVGIDHIFARSFIQDPSNKGKFTA